MFIHEVDRAVGPSGPSKSWDRVDDLPKVGSAAWGVTATVSASARLASSTSVLIPHHLMIRPDESFSGLTWNRNQRYMPSNLRKRASDSPAWPDDNRARQ